MCFENTVTGSKLFLDSGGILPFIDLSNGCLCTITAPQGGFFSMTLQHRPPEPLCFVQFQFEDAVSGFGEYVFCGTAPLPDYDRNLTTRKLDGMLRLVTSSDIEPTDTDFCFQLELTGLSYVHLV